MLTSFDPIVYAGATPGADSNTYVLWTSIGTRYAEDFISSYGYHRLVLDIATAAAGTLKWEKSSDGGALWIPMGSEALAATGSAKTETRDYLIEAAADFRLRFVNGGSAQHAVLTGNVAMNGGGVPAAVAGKSFTLTVGATSFTITFATPADEAAILAAINAVLGAAATATVNGSHYLVLTSSGLGSIDAIQATAGTLALATIGFDTTSVAVGWAPTMGLVHDRAPSLWEQLKTSLVSKVTSALGWLNVLPGLRYRLAPETLADGDITVPTCDNHGDQRVVLVNTDGITPKYPDSVALVDALATPTATRYGALNMAYNGATWDFARSAIVVKTATKTGFQNFLPMGVYKAAAETLVDGDATVLTMLQDGSLRVAETRQPAYEDNTNAVAAQAWRPLAVNTYVTTGVMSAALEASHILKATPGVLYSLYVRVDSTLATGTYYIQILNSATLPAEGAVTHLFVPVKVQHTQGTDDHVVAPLPDNGVYGSAGIVVVLSSTEYSKTIGGAYLSMDGRVA